MDEDDENVGLVTGVAELRHSFNPSIEILWDDSCGNENRMERDEDVADYDCNALDCSKCHDRTEDALSLLVKASARFPPTFPRQRLSMDSSNLPCHTLNFIQHVLKTLSSQLLYTHPGQRIQDHMINVKVHTVLYFPNESLKTKIRALPTNLIL